MYSANGSLDAEMHHPHIERCSVLFGYNGRVYFNHEQFRRCQQQQPFHVHYPVQLVLVRTCSSELKDFSEAKLSWLQARVNGS